MIFFGLLDLFAILFAFLSELRNFSNSYVAYKPDLSTGVDFGQLANRTESDFWNWKFEFTNNFKSTTQWWINLSSLCTHLFCVHAVVHLESKWTLGSCGRKDPSFVLRFAERPESWPLCKSSLSWVNLRVKNETCRGALSIVYPNVGTPKWRPKMNERDTD